MQRLSLLLVRGEPAPRGGPLTSPRLPPWGRPIAAACFRREMAARTCVRLRRETRLQLQAMRQLLHALFE